MIAHVKRMSVKEFRALGLLQEVNRQFLHPRGLALEITVDDTTREESFGGVWDYRDDPEGIIFGDAPAKKKAAEAERLYQEKKDARQKKLGYIIQPLEDD